jgi:hypothetical protein
MIEVTFAIAHALSRGLDTFPSGDWARGATCPLAS